MGRLSKKFVTVWSVAVFAAMLFGAQAVRAQHVYQWDTGFIGESFNNSEGTETEDNWVGNAFQVVTGGTHLTSIDLGLGTGVTNRPVTVLIYLGEDISNPCAGGGLHDPIYQQDTIINGNPGDLLNIPLNPAVDLQVGDVFYAAILMRGVTGDIFPFLNDTSVPLGHSFFDVGPAQGAPYDLTVQSWRHTVFGGTHPVVDSGVQSPGSLILRVNSTGGPDISIDE